MNPILTKNFTAGGTISPYRVAKFGADDNTVLQAAASTDSLLGVVNIPEGGDAASGDSVDVVIAGIANVEYGGNITRGDLLTSDANGKVVTATRHTHTENTAGAYTQNATTGTGTSGRIIGVAMVSGVAGDIGAVNVLPAFN